MNMFYHMTSTKRKTVLAITFMNLKTSTVRKSFHIQASDPVKESKSTELNSDSILLNSIKTGVVVGIVLISERETVLHPMMPHDLSTLFSMQMKQVSPSFFFNGGQERKHMYMLIQPRRVNGLRDRLLRGKDKT